MINGFRDSIIWFLYSVKKKLTNQAEGRDKWRETLTTEITFGLEHFLPNWGTVNFSGEVSAPFSHLRTHIWANMNVINIYSCVILTRVF